MNNNRTRAVMILQAITGLHHINMDLETSIGGGDFYIYSSGALLLRKRDRYIDIPDRLSNMDKLPVQSPWSVEYE